ncbi:MAG: phosphoglycerate kinase, partial [Candidatus Levyibacteriota bacterium]
DVYINDGFAVDHRNEATIVTVPKHLPSYGGLLLKNEVQALSKIVDNPKKPVVAIIGGAKISTKIMLIEKLLHLADSVILGGALASTFLLAKGYEVGQSLVEKDMVGEAKKLLALAKDMQKDLLLPVDVTGTTENSNEVIAKKADAITPDFSVFDIGQETEKIFRTCIEEANTIVWNGPVGLFEKKPFDNGTTAIFEAVITNAHAFSVVGGGDTLAAIEHKNGKEKITHISTGGGAMLDFVQNGTLPGLDAIRK